jgi:hypothetical protein
MGKKGSKKQRCEEEENPGWRWGSGATSHDEEVLSQHSQAAPLKDK